MGFEMLTEVRICFQLGIFLNRLTSQPIGLTACGLFVLDKPTIITVSRSELIITSEVMAIMYKSLCT